MASKGQNGINIYKEMSSKGFKALVGRFLGVKSSISKSKKVREMHGGLKAAKYFFKIFKKYATDIRHEKITINGRKSTLKKYTLSDGTVVTFRRYSKSGGPVIEFHGGHSFIDNQKIHFIK